MLHPIAYVVGQWPHLISECSHLVLLKSPICLALLRSSDNVLLVKMVQFCKLTAHQNKAGIRSVSRIITLTVLMSINQASINQYYWIKVHGNMDSSNGQCNKVCAKSDVFQVRFRSLFITKLSWMSFVLHVSCCEFYCNKFVTATSHHH